VTSGICLGLRIRLIAIPQRSCAFDENCKSPNAWLMATVTTLQFNRLQKKECPNDFQRSESVGIDVKGRSRATGEIRGQFIVGT
jgi:hypothetical protein